jgi:hypothetical protein
MDGAINGNIWCDTETDKTNQITLGVLIEVSLINYTFLLLVTFECHFS